MAGGLIYTLNFADVTEKEAVVGLLQVESWVGLDWIYDLFIYIIF